MNKIKAWNGIILLVVLCLGAFPDKLLSSENQSNKPETASQSTALTNAGSSQSTLSLTIRHVEDFLNSIGMSCHFSGKCEKPMQLLKEAGIRNIRDEISWDWVEKEKGKYQIPPEREAWVTEALKNNINILLILDYGNPLYPQMGVGDKDNPEENFEAFTAYAAFLVNYFKGKINQYEIWNEPNGFLLNKQYGGDWRGGDWVKAYARLADKTTEKIRSINPEAKLYTAGMEAPIANLVVSHLKETYDAIAIHPYCAPLLPEYTRPQIAQLRQTLSDLNINAPLIVTEQGYPTIKGKFMWRHVANITQEDQAKFLLRVFCGNFAQNIQRTYWYDFICDGTDPKEQEHNFGILNSGDLSPRPAYTALKNLTSWLSQSDKDEPDNASAVLGKEVNFHFDTPPTYPPRGLLLARSSTHYYLILWMETPSRDEIEIDEGNVYEALQKDPATKFKDKVPNFEARAFRNGGGMTEEAVINIPAFAAGRLRISMIDTITSVPQEPFELIYSDGLVNKFRVYLSDHPVVYSMSFK